MKQPTEEGDLHMLLGDILFSLMTALINTIFTTPIFSFLNNLFGIPFRAAGV